MKAAKDAGSNETTKKEMKLGDKVFLGILMGGLIVAIYAPMFYK